MVVYVLVVYVYLYYLSQPMLVASHTQLLTKHKKVSVSQVYKVLSLYLVLARYSNSLEITS